MKILLLKSLLVVEQYFNKTELITNPDPNQIPVMLLNEVTKNNFWFLYGKTEITKVCKMGENDFKCAMFFIIQPLNYVAL